MAVVAEHAKAKGVQFCQDMPLIPSLKEFKDSQLRRGRRPSAAQTAATDPDHDAALAADNDGEGTTLLGRGTWVKPSCPEALEVHNAVGFFLFTACPANRRGDWPDVMGATALEYKRLLFNAWRSYQLPSPSVSFKTSVDDNLCSVLCAHEGMKMPMVMSPWLDMQQAHAGATHLEDDVGAPCVAWAQNLHPLQLSMLYKYTRYSRASVYGTAYVTSDKYKATKQRDNQWITFQHHLSQLRSSPALLLSVQVFMFQPISNSRRPAWAAYAGTGKPRAHV